MMTLLAGETESQTEASTSNGSTFATCNMQRAAFAFTFPFGSNNALYTARVGSQPEMELQLESQAQAIMLAKQLKAWALQLLLPPALLLLLMVLLLVLLLLCMSLTL